MRYTHLQNSSDISALLNEFWKPGKEFPTSEDLSKPSGLKCFEQTLEVLTSFQFFLVLFSKSVHLFLRVTAASHLPPKNGMI